MTWLYAVSLVAGILALIIWALRRSSAREPSETSGVLDPQVIAAAVAFGMGGMSASYAGWNPWPAAGAAIVAAGLGVMLARSGGAVGERDHD